MVESRPIPSMFVLVLAVVLLSSPLQAEPKTYTVKPGDCLAKIAEYHGVSQIALRRVNKLDKGATLEIGATLTIPHVLRGGALRSHVVLSGDTLAGIAGRYDVTAAALARANNLQSDSTLGVGQTLAIPDAVAPDARYKPRVASREIKSGKIVKNGVLHKIQVGQSLWLIARAYGVGGDKIARANGLKAGAALRPGKSILIPGATKVLAVEASSGAIQPIRFVRAYNGEQASLTLVSTSGKVIAQSRKTLSQLCRAKTGKERVMLLNPRLLVLLQQVADRFPGKTFEIISGFRPYEEGNESKHSQGRAIDFRLIGAPNKEVYGFIKTLSNVGAGYYPNSVFVHLDVRDKTVLWTDVSGVGQKPRYTSKKLVAKKPKVK